MEFVALTDQQLTYLAEKDPNLKWKYVGTLPCDGLPKHPVKTRPRAYIVNTDPHDQPGQHWIALWTQNNLCEVMDSYALPLEVYQQAKPLQDWVMKHWKYVVSNGSSLQGLHSKACGHYALMYLKLKARGGTLQDFVQHFSDYDRVNNDHLVGEFLKEDVNEKVWLKEGHQTCQSRCDK